MRVLFSAGWDGPPWSVTPLNPQNFATFTSFPVKQLTVCSLSHDTRSQFIHHGRVLLFFSKTFQSVPDLKKRLWRACAGVNRGLSCREGEKEEIEEIVEELEVGEPIHSPQLLTTLRRIDSSLPLPLPARRRTRPSRYQNRKEACFSVRRCPAKQKHCCLCGFLDYRAVVGCPSLSTPTDCISKRQPSAC